MSDRILDTMVWDLKLEIPEEVVAKAKECLRISRVRGAPRLLGSMACFLPQTCLQLICEQNGIDSEWSIVSYYNMNLNKFRNCVKNVASLLEIEQKKDTLTMICVNLGINHIRDPIAEVFGMFKQNLENELPESQRCADVCDDPDIISSVVYVALNSCGYRISKKDLHPFTGSRTKFEKWIVSSRRLLDVGAMRKTIPLREKKRKSTAQPDITVSPKKPKFSSQKNSSVNSNSVNNATAPTEDPPSKEINANNVESYFLGILHNEEKSAIESWKGSILRRIQKDHPDDIRSIIDSRKRMAPVTSVRD